MSARPRVLLDFSLVAPGGSATYTRGFLDALSRRADLDDVTVLVAHQDGDMDDVIGKLIDAGATVRRTRLRSGWASAVARQVLVPYVSVRSRAQGVFCTREAAPILTPAPLLVLARNLIVWSPGGLTALRARCRRLATQMVSRLAIARAAQVVTVSSVMAGKLPRPAGRATIVIHHGCDLEAVVRVRLESGGSPQELRIVALGSIAPHKRFDTLIDAVAELRAQGQAARLEIWGATGDQTCAEALRRIARERLGDDPLMGPAPPRLRQEILADADVLALGSSFESFGLPLLEGMRTACLIWAPASDVVDELCGPVAVTYPEGSPEAAARALINALPSAPRLLFDGRHRSQAFTWESTVDQTLRAVRLVASKRSEHEP